MTAPWLVWQLADSAFPAGGFGHSFGLEAASQQSEIDAGSLPAFVRDAIAQAGHGGLPFLFAAFDDPHSIGVVDERCEAFLRNPVSNRASRVQGRAWLGTIARSFPADEVQEIVALVRARARWRHSAPIFGATLNALNIERSDAARLFLFGAARGTLSASVRLGITGTTDAQRILSERSQDLDRTIRRCGHLTIDEAAQTSPLIDLWQAAHDRLYSRLFQS
jgi:urease accessory protein